MSNRKQNRQRLRAKRKSSYRPGRRRSVMMNFAIVMVLLMAASLIMASYSRKASSPYNIKSSSSHSRSAPAQKATHAPTMPGDLGF